MMKQSEVYKFNGQNFYVLRMDNFPFDTGRCWMLRLEDDLIFDYCPRMQDLTSKDLKTSYDLPKFILTKINIESYLIQKAYEKI